MKGYFDSKLSEALSLNIGDNYDITYGYDDAGRIIKETVAGSISRKIDYVYDELDNISTETITLEDKTIVKTYIYDEYNNITNVNVKTTGGGA